MEVTGGMQNKNISLETGIKRKEMGCFLFRNMFWGVLFGLGCLFFLIESTFQSGRQKIN